MLKFELPSVIPAPGNPFAPMPTSDIGISLDMPVTIRPAQAAEAAPVEEVAPLAATMAQLIEAMQSAEGLFKQAFQLALNTRDRETELLQRAEAAERETRHHERQATEWKQRFETLDQKIPKWVRKLFRAS